MKVFSKTGAKQVDLAARAAIISLLDSGGFFTAANVEAALQELAAPTWLIARLEAASGDPWDQQFNNLLKGGSFESWSAGAAGAAPDGWTAGIPANCNREATIIRIGEYSVKLTKTNGNWYLYQTPVTPIDADTNTYWRGRTVTLGCWVYCDTASTARLRIYDAIGATASSDHTGGSSWEWLTVTRTIDAAATYIQAILDIVTNNTDAYFDGAVLVEGTICPPFAPHPNDQHLKAIDYQSSAPANFDYGLLRMECGIATLVFGGAAAFANIAVTFGTAFTTILGAQATVLVNNGLTAGQMRGDVSAQNLATNQIGTLIHYTGDGTNPDAADSVDVAWIAIGVGP